LLPLYNQLDVQPKPDSFYGKVNFTHWRCALAKRASAGTHAPATANVLEGKLLSAADVRACWAAAIASLWGRDMGMGDRIASRGAHRPPGELRVIVEAEVRDLLEAVPRGNL
jgi:hypothetical protein